MDVGLGRVDGAEACGGGRRGDRVRIKVTEGVSHTVGEVGHEFFEVVGVPEGLGDIGGVVGEV